MVWFSLHQFITVLFHHIWTANTNQLKDTVSVNLLVEGNVFVFVVAVLTAVRWARLNHGCWPDDTHCDPDWFRTKQRWSLSAATAQASLPQTMMAARIGSCDRHFRILVAELAPHYFPNYPSMSTRGNQDFINSPPGYKMIIFKGCYGFNFLIKILLNQRSSKYSYSTWSLHWFIL